MAAGRHKVLGLAVVALVALLVTIGAGTARAEEPVVVPVEISAAQPGSSIQVRGRGREFACGEHCVLQLPQHDYRVIVRDRDGNESRTSLTIMTPTSLTVAPGDHGDKMLGIGLFVGGLAATVVGLAAIYASLLETSTTASGECTGGCGATWHLYAGALSLAAGVGLGATGIILWRAAGHARVAVSPLALSATF